VGVAARDGDAPALDREAPVVELDPAALEQLADRADVEARLLAFLDLEGRAEDAREVAHVFGNEEIVLHEALDAARAAMVGVAHAPPDLGLQVEGQPVLGAPRHVVQPAAQRPQEVARLGEGRGLALGEDALADQFLGTARAFEERERARRPQFGVRDAARQRMGDRFDIRDFHEVVLAAGAVPLGVLQERVEAWSAA
jgi:hypothetical protein